MDLIETKEILQSEYNQLISELDELKKTYIELKEKHSKMELQDLELYYELEELSNNLFEDTEIDEANEKKYIENNYNKLAIKLPLTSGVSLSLLITIILLLKGKLIISIAQTIGLIIGHLSSGMIIGIVICFLYKKKYQSILKEKYKHTPEHQKHSTKHYDKMLNLMRQKENYNNHHQEYLKIKQEYITIERQYLSKQEELKQFKEKIIEILFQNEIETQENNSNYSKCQSNKSTTHKKILKAN